MKNIAKAFLNFIKSHKIWTLIIILVVVGVIWFVRGDNQKKLPSDFASVEKGNIEEQVSVTGNVKPLSDVDLAFERGGRVASINVSVGSRVYAGQVLTSISNADLAANLNQAEANLKKVKAGLGSSVDKTNLSLIQSRNSLLNSIRDSYTKADDALRNKIYSLFNDPVRYNASLIFSTDTFLREDIEDGKDELSDVLDLWARSLTKLDESSDLKSEYDTAQKNLSLVKSLLDKSATAVNALTPEQSGQSQTQIDIWKSNISTARTSINTAIDSLTASFDQVTTASLSSKISARDAMAEEASVEQAQAQVASAEAELAKTIIRSPIDGVVTDLPIKLGEIVPMNQKAVSVISYGEYQVESFVPEADISKIKLNNKAETTLDAYGNDVKFETAVIKIDPAATMIDGVPTYKVTLKFVNQDERIRSGMTANLDILTAEKNDVLVVPARAVYTKDDGKYTKVIDAAGVISEKKIEVGLRGFDGRVEILSGLEEGEHVSTAL